MYRVGDEVASLRDIQLATDSCWCKNPPFLTELERPFCGSPFRANEVGARLWFTLLFPKVTLYRVERLVPDIGLMCPPDTWYYGCREDHRVDTEYGYPVIHSCVTVLVGCAEPQSLSSIRQGVESIVSKTLIPGVDVSSCPPHLTREEGVSFLPVAAWVQARISFIDAAGKGVSGEGLKSGVFGYSGILAVLRFQFGSASNPLVTEMALAKQNSDEEDGIVPGGLAPVQVDQSGAGGTIYVVTPEGTDVDPIEIS